MMSRHARLLGSALALTGSFGATALAQTRACTDLAALARPDLRITRAEPVPAGTLPTENRGRAALAGPDRAAMPAHCVVDGMIAAAARRRRVTSAPASSFASGGLNASCCSRARRHGWVVVMRRASSPSPAPPRRPP